MNYSQNFTGITYFVGVFLFTSMLTGCGDSAGLFSTSEPQPEESFFLYGKTLDNEDLDWESLRGKYVLVKFTATWCPPCQLAIPGMLEAYEKYHDKGFTIVSVYIWERGEDPVATVKRFVEREKLPWIIISESLTEQAGQPPQGATYGIEGVPTMVLLDKEGKFIAFGPEYKEALEKALGK